MHELDITAEVCPMTFVRTKLQLEKMAAGEVLKIKLREGDPLVNVPRALKDHGQEILSVENVGSDIFEITVRKS